MTRHVQKLWRRHWLGRSNGHGWYRQLMMRQLRYPQEQLNGLALCPFVCDTSWRCSLQQEYSSGKICVLRLFVR